MAFFFLFFEHFLCLNYAITVIFLFFYYVLSCFYQVQIPDFYHSFCSFYVISSLYLEYENIYGLDFQHRMPKRIFSLNLLDN